LCSSTSGFLMQNIVKLAPLWKVLQTPWCYIIFGIRRLNLAKYLLVFMVYSHLLQVVPCIMATAKTASIQLWMRSETMGMVFLCCLTYDVFVGDDPKLASIWTTCDVGFKTILLSLHLNLGCSNNYVELRCMWTICELVVTCDMYVESCTILVVFGDDSRSFVIFDGLPGLYELKCVRVNM
jgi:hypothetical protein